MVEGVANHAGTTPMNRRHDAAVSAAEFVLAVNRIALTTLGTQVATVGRIRAEPGAPNVIPGRVEMSLEIRDLASEKMESVFQAISAEATRIADARGTPIRFSEVDVALLPAPSDERLRRKIETAADSLRLTHRRMPSGAGHDAQDMARQRRRRIPQRARSPHATRIAPQPRLRINSPPATLPVPSVARLYGRT
jgi:N-carbamoyl-L-amino-acid hydrolase